MWSAAQHRRNKHRESAKCAGCVWPVSFPAQGGSSPTLSVPGHVDAVFRANAEHFRCVHFSTDAANVCEVRWRPRSRRSGRSISLEGIWASAVQRSVEP